MNKGFYRGLTPFKLKMFLLLLLLALAIPMTVLVFHAQQQIKWEALHHYRTLAEEMADRIDTQLQVLLSTEESRRFSDYQFLILGANQQQTKYLQQSPLAQFPLPDATPGLIGHFQIEADGLFSTPLLPNEDFAANELGIDPSELMQRKQQKERLLEILSTNQLLSRQQGPSKSVVATMTNKNDMDERDNQASVYSDDTYVSNKAEMAFDSLRQKTQSEDKSKAKVLGRVADLKLEESAIAKGLSAPQPFLEKRIKSAKKSKARVSRKEQTALLEQEVAISGDADLDDALQSALPQRISMFESDIDPFEFSRLDSGHFVLFRKVWRNGQRIIQGLLIDEKQFIDATVENDFMNTSLAAMSDLVVAYRGDMLSVFKGHTERSYISSRNSQQHQQQFNNTLLHQVRLSAPLGEMQLLWTINRLPSGPGAGVIYWSSGVLFIVLCLGFLFLYLVGLRQIKLTRQQQDFVSSVSHELKTPLTSIRMFSEMLREGWVSPEKQSEYYNFIHDESERLSRLITNVLQLARMDRNGLDLVLKPVSVVTLLDMIKSKIASHIERSDFTIDYQLDANCGSTELNINADAFIQIMLNLIDNAIKFSAQATDKKIIISACACTSTSNSIVWCVRDFGPGIPNMHTKKIFDLFYRSESELTRETKGTGIGLALVHQLTLAMSGTADVRNRDPGAEFQLTFPAKQSREKNN